MGNYSPFYKASELVAINIHLRRRQKWYIAKSGAHNTDKSVYDSIKQRSSW
jgi:hypothetical protein